MHTHIGIDFYIMVLVVAVVSEELRQRVKEKAVKERTSVSVVIRRFLEGWVEGGGARGETGPVIWEERNEARPAVYRKPSNSLRDRVGGE